MNADLVIVGGTVVDGTGGAPVCADVAIERGRIAHIGCIPVAEGTPRLDATGLLVAPGFVDIHSHSDFTLFVDPRAVSSISQGVTFELVGNCGHGCAPIGDPQTARSNIYGCSSEYEIPWRTVDEYLSRLEERHPAVNVATLVPNGNLRLAVAGAVDRPSTPDEIRQMKRLLSQGMEEGALGYSTGLEYAAERACTEEEIEALCRVTSRKGGFYATHTRNRAGEARETIAEAINTAGRAEIPLQISHISVVARLSDDGRLAVEQAINQVDEARRRGQDVGFDMHTRLFGTTNLSAILPQWALEGGPAEIAARLHSPSTRRELQSHHSIITALARNDWSRIVVYESKAAPEYSRRSIAEVAAARGVGPFDAIYDLLLQELDDMHSLMVIALAYRESDLRLAFAHPECMIGSDATALAPDGPLAKSSFHGAYTWASWFFRHFVRETRMITAGEAVRRLTSLPARRIGLTDRGVIREGAWADLAVFNPDTFGETGTMFEPNQIAAGMVHVLVNGVIGVQDGRLTGERGGQVVRSR